MRCASCFRLGHIALHCRFPPRFPGLSMSEKSPSFSPPLIDNFPSSHSWFRSSIPLPCGPSASKPLHFDDWGSFCSVSLGISPTVAPSSIHRSLTPAPSTSPNSTQQRSVNLHSRSPPHQPSLFTELCHNQDSSGGEGEPGTTAGEIGGSSGAPSRKPCHCYY